MAKLNVEDLIDFLEPEIRKSLEATLRQHFSQQEYNSRAVFKTFKEEVGKKSMSWKSIPNKFIRSE